MNGPGRFFPTANLVDVFHTSTVEVVYGLR